MAAKGVRGRNGPAFVVVCGLALCLGLAAYLAQSPGRDVPAGMARPETAAEPDRDQGQEVRAYEPRYEGDELKLSPSPARSPRDTDARVFAVNSYLQRLPMVPREARARSCRVEGGIATLDFTSAFDRTYGTEDEQTVLKGLLTVMAQFAEVKAVRVTVEGRPMETLGSVDLTGPLPVEPLEETAPHATGATPAKS